MLLRDPHKTAKTTLICEGEYQGGWLYMLAYGLGALPIVNYPQEELP